MTYCGNQKFAAPKVHNSRIKFVKNQPIVGACYDCEIVVKYIEGWLFENSTEVEIVTELDKLCTYISQFSSTCDALVQYGVDSAIQYIATNEDPETLCTQIGEC